MWDQHLNPEEEEMKKKKNLNQLSLWLLSSLVNNLNQNHNKSQYYTSAG
jgi:hypothetical protein